MIIFRSTADIRSPDERSLKQYMGLFCFSFIFVVILDLVVSEVRSIENDPTRIASLAAFLITMPRAQPKFRSLRRFALGVFLSVFLTLALVYCVGKSGGLEASLSNSLFHAILGGVVVGAIEFATFLSVCLATPGRD